MIFQIGSFVVFCGLLAQTTAQLEGLPLGQGLPLPLGQGLPLPLGQGLPLIGTPALPSNLAGSFTGGESVPASFRYVCAHMCVQPSYKRRGRDV
jgi:hypothetical protein